MMRQTYLARRKAMLPHEVKNKGHIIGHKLIHSSYYQQCTNLFCYVSHDNEVDTRSIIHQAWQDNKEVYVPKVMGKGQMFFYPITSMEDLTTGRYGILEPQPTIDHTPIRDSLLIMPGVVFDKDRNRIGYGGGFYDRYLAKLQERPMLIALCYNNQLVDTLKPDPYDIKPDYILTEVGWVK